MNFKYRGDAPKRLASPGKEVARVLSIEVMHLRDWHHLER